MAVLRFGRGRTIVRQGSRFFRRGSDFSRRTDEFASAINVSILTDNGDVVFVIPDVLPVRTQDDGSVHASSPRFAILDCIIIRLPVIGAVSVFPSHAPTGLVVAQRERAKPEIDPTGNPRVVGATLFQRGLFRGLSAPIVAGVTVFPRRWRIGDRRITTAADLQRSVLLLRLDERGEYARQNHREKSRFHERNLYLNRIPRRAFLTRQSTRYSHLE